ncbi:MAG: bifunctional methylenetetrahydrofolate dehydrogenase/methenyltetrahydrofolate cyclohydrolase FolD [Vampirovibrionales bacterium]|nr:bifunctional methylenetetrahydrofolate dehydrogenase/methenyltetrahydrofolate cyclohydrolase FolD [Vampirovibrionales bacterium]
MQNLHCAQIIDGKAVAQALLERVQRQVQVWSAQQLPAPGLTVVRVGDDPASGVYVAKKAKTAEQLGIRSSICHLPATVSQRALFETLDALNADTAVNAVLLQLPIARHLDTYASIARLTPEKDVDGFHPENLGLLMAGLEPTAPPCTPAGIMALLAHCGVPLAGANAVVIGRSMIVGKPVALMLLNQSATVSVCHSQTRDLAKITQQADVLISAVGVPGLITGEMIKPGAVVIDVGINRITEGERAGKLTGDVAFDSALSVCGQITPVPGGVGPMTIAMLMRNTARLYARQNGLSCDL